jgi:plastocyanin
VRTLFQPRLAAGLSAGVLALALSACGGSSATDAGSAVATATTTASGAGTSSAVGSSAGSGTAATAPQGTGTPVTATEGDFSIALSSSDLAAGTHTFTVTNAGKATHSLTIKGPGGVDMTSDKVQGGQSTTMTVTLQPGTYQVYCPIGNHQAMGMDTTLTVR